MLRTLLLWSSKNATLAYCSFVQRFLFCAFLLNMLATANRDVSCNLNAVQGYLSGHAPEKPTDNFDAILEDFCAQVLHGEGSSQGHRWFRFGLCSD